MKKEVQFTLTKEVCETAFQLFLKEEMSEFLSPTSKEEGKFFENIIEISKRSFFAGTIAGCNHVGQQAKKIIEETMK